jgi:hypothetical protein
MMGDGSIDERLAFLACAGARLALIEEGLLSIDEAFNPAFVERFRKIGRLTCHCEEKQCASSTPSTGQCTSRPTSNGRGGDHDADRNRPKTDRAPK